MLPVVKRFLAYSLSQWRAKEQSKALEIFGLRASVFEGCDVVGIGVVVCSGVVVCLSAVVVSTGASRVVGSGCDSLVGDSSLVVCTFVDCGVVGVVFESAVVLAASSVFLAFLRVDMDVEVSTSAPCAAASGPAASY